MTYLGQDKPPLDDSLLEHFGVKGMKWGIVKKSDNVDANVSSKVKQNELSKKYMAVEIKNKTHSEAIKSISENNKKFSDKFESSSSKNNSESFIKNHKKQIVLGLEAAAIIGVIAYGVSSNKKNIAAIKQLAGQKVDVSQYTNAVNASKTKTWGLQGYMHPSSYTRSEFTLPKGHTFHRLSLTAEDSFGATTYATHSVDDYNRYVSAFRKEKGLASKLYKITFSTDEDVRVPHVTTVLESLKTVLNEKHGYEVTSAQVLESYQSITGGTWKDPVSLKLIESLKAKGYGALVDEMDAGVIGESPLVMFSNKLTSKVASVIDAKDTEVAEKSLIEISNRKL